MLGYIITEGQDPNTYTGYRCATSDMEVNDGEQFVESLEGWSPFIPPAPPKSPQQKLVELTGLIASLDYETQADLLPYSGQIATALNAGQVEVAKVVVGRIETNEDAQLEALKQAVQAILES
jgi:hypothetical protein